MTGRRSEVESARPNFQSNDTHCSEIIFSSSSTKTWKSLVCGYFPPEERDRHGEGVSISSVSVDDEFCFESPEQKPVSPTPEEIRSEQSVVDDRVEGNSSELVGGEVEQRTFFEEWTVNKIREDGLSSLSVIEDMRQTFAPDSSPFDPRLLFSETEFRELQSRAIATKSSRSTPTRNNRQDEKPSPASRNQAMAVESKTSVGHAGTLDPLATGLLIVCLGKATKLADSYQAMTKVYSGTFRLGEATPSLDADTEVSDTLPWEHIKDEDIQRAKQKFTGDILQSPPMYSAIKVKGERLYAKARRGEEIDVPARQVTVQESQINRSPHNRQEFHFRVTCSEGTYIRSLCSDLGRALGRYVLILTQSWSLTTIFTEKNI
ncbi:hypothetical protein R1flu_015711 [Riccia fluitans]|uniref:tRNA pseudouridine(55) synthase n=1 Tax=Riccia fluitans TaxID=41844 RepID=A0ABD1YK15_9MARC